MICEKIKINFQRERESKKGFTLIELLIVIAIIGILSSIVLVSLNSARDKAKISKALASCQSVSKLIEICQTGGSNAIIPSSASGNPGSVICSGGLEIYPDISDTGFYYHTDVFYSNYNTGQYAFTASGTVGSSFCVIVCASNINVNGWYGLSVWNFIGMSGCKTYGC